MKIEPRGKFGGVKVHLDSKEAEAILGNYQAHKGMPQTAPKLIAAKPFSVRFPFELGQKIEHLLMKHPDLMQDKSEEQIKAELELEKSKSEKKLAAMAAGQSWDPKKGIEVD